MRERIGPKDHGNAAFAARKEVVYHPSGYFTFPIKVLQRGNREFQGVGSAPATVARPPATTFAVHILVIGNAGSGKGVYLGAHIFATSTVPIVYFDFKGEMPAYLLRPSMLRWGFPGERPKGLPSLRFNFIQWVLGHEDPDTASKALAAAILPANSQKETENQWIKDTAIPILGQGILSRRWRNLAELADEIEHTPLPELLNNIETGRGRMFSMEGKNVPNYAANEISNNTQALLAGRARHIVTDSDFTMDEAFQKGLYVMGQAANEAEKRLLKIFWGVFWFELLRKGSELPLCVFIDEGIAAGPIPRVLEALVTLRDRGVCLVQAFQFTSGITEVYGREKAQAVMDGHQTKIYLTKGLADDDITHLSKSAKTYTKRIDDKRTEARPLVPEDELKRHARQEKFWAFIDGVQWTTSGRPIMAALLPTPGGEGWNWRATPAQYEAELERLSYGLDWRSPYRMRAAGVVEEDGKRYRHWVPMFEPEAGNHGVTEKFVPLEAVKELAGRLLSATSPAAAPPADLPPTEIDEEPWL